MKGAKPQEDMKTLLGTRKVALSHSEASQSNLTKYKTMVRAWLVRDHRNILDEPIKFCLIENIKQCSRNPFCYFLLFFFSGNRREKFERSQQFYTSLYKNQIA